MNDIKITQKPIADLIPYSRNPRKNDEAVPMVMNSIKEFGFKVPIVIDKNKIIVCGHTRFKAALNLGLETVPCIVADDLSDEQIKAFRLADNKVSQLCRQFEQVQTQEAWSSIWTAFLRIALC